MPHPSIVHRLMFTLAIAASLTMPCLADDDATDAQKPKADFPALAELTKDMTAVPGLMTFFRYKESDIAKDQTRLLCVVPKSLLGQDLLFAANISRGDKAGWQWVDGLVRWEQVGRQLKLVAPDTRFLNKPGDPIGEAVERTYRPSFVFALPIVSLTPAGDPVIDLGQAIFSPAPLVRSPAAGVKVRREISRISAVKSFPDNALIDVDIAIASSVTSQGGSTYGISYAFRRLPDLKSYAPRRADERVGYFTTDRQDWSTKYDQREMIERFINRWQLRKKDPSLELSPPEKPIVFIIDKSVPLQWRRFVSEGILEWNKAFEKIGIVGAVVVQQQTDDNEFAGIDPADARYNFIQWTVRNVTLAVGPSRPDPRTGQILDADIVIDDSWIRHYNDSIELFTPKALAAGMGPETLRFLEENPKFMPPGVSMEDVRAARSLLGRELMQSDADPSAALEMPSLMPSARRQCEMALGVMQQLAITQLIGQEAKARGLPKVPDSVIGGALKRVVMHEVGHTLGLRHNFKASSWLSMEQIKQARDKGEPFVASVMDYTPMVFFDTDDMTRQTSFATGTIGPYDYWAIEYGYGMPKEGQKVSDFLASVTSRSAEPQFAYATDEDTLGLVSPDPLVNRYDLSSSPVAYAKNQIALTDKLLANVQEWAQQSDEPNHYLREAFGRLQFERSRQLSYVARLVGGQYFSRSRAADPNAPTPLTLVDTKLQRDALALISKTVLSDGFYEVDPDLLNRLAPHRNWSWSEQPAQRIDFPFHAFVQRQYSETLLALCSPQVLQRVYDAEAKTRAADKITAAELIRTVRESVWSELARKNFDGVSDATPAISTIRRNMQCTHLQYLLATAESEPGELVSPDLRNLVRYSLRELSEQIAQTLDRGGKRLDFATRGHLIEARSRIDRTLDKPVVELNSGPATIIIQSAQDDAP